MGRDGIRRARWALAIGGTLVVGLVAGACTYEREGCTYSENAIELDEQTLLGYSAMDVLDAVEGSYWSRLEWKEWPGAVETNAPAGATDLGIDLRYEGGEVTFVDAAGPLCGSRLKIEATLALRTADGLLEETVPVVLVNSECDHVCAFGPDAVDQGRFQAIYEELPEFNGDLELTMRPDRSFKSFRFSGSFADGDPTGELELEYSSKNGGHTSLLAVWPPEDEGEDP